MPEKPDHDAILDDLLARTPHLYEVLANSTVWPQFIQTTAPMEVARLGSTQLLRATTDAAGARVGLCLLGPGHNQLSAAGPQEEAVIEPAALWQMLGRDDSEATEFARQLLTDPANAFQVVEVCDRAAATSEGDRVTLIFEYLGALQQAPWQGDTADFVLIGAPVAAVKEHD